MADKNIVQEVDRGEQMIAQAKDFWTKYQKQVMAVCGAVILLSHGLCKTCFEWRWRKSGAIKSN